MTPDLDTLSDLVVLTDQWEQAGESLERLLEQVLPRIQQQIPEVQELVVYTRQGTVLAAIATTNNIHLEKQIPFDDLATVTSGIKVEGDTWMFPLLRAGTLFGELEFVLSSPSEPEIEIKQWLQMVAQYVAAPIDRQIADKLANTQSFVIRELSNCQSFVEIAQVLGENLLKSGQYLAINLAEYDEQDSMNAVRTVATANRREAFAVDTAIDVDPDNMEPLLRSVMIGGEALFIHDVQSHPEISEKFKNWDTSKTIHSSLMIPIRFQERIYGLISINSLNSRVHTQPTEIDLLQSIADYVGVMIRLHDMTQENVASNIISEQQAEVFEALFATQNIGEMAHTIAKYMLPQPGRFLTIQELIYDEQGEVTEWRALASANRKQGYELHTKAPVSWKDLNEGLKKQALAMKATVTPDVDALEPEDLGPTFLEWLKSKGVKSTLNVPMLVADRPTAVLTIQSRYRHTFSDNEIQAFQNIAGYLGKLIHSQRLLQEANETRNTIGQLVRTSRAISRTEDLEELSRIMLDAMPESISAVAIAEFDHESTPENPPNSMALEVVVTRETSFYPEAVDHFEAGNQRIVNGIASLLEGNVSIVEDIRERDIPVLMPNAIQYMRDIGTYSYISAGLRSGSTLLGLIVIGSAENVRLDQTQLDNILSIVDQVAVVIENRHLLQSAETTLNEVQLLYDLNRDLIAASDSVDVLTTLKSHLFPDATSLILVTFEWDEISGDLLSLVSDSWIRNDRAAQPKQQLIHNLSAEDIENLKAEWELQGRDVDVISDIEAALPERPALKFSLDRGVHASVVIPIYDGDYIVQQITITFSTTKQFDEVTRRLLNATRDQIGVVLENQRLLVDMRTAAAHLGNQVRVLQTINHLAAQLTATQNEKVMLDEAGEALYGALRVDHVGIVIDDGNGQTATVMSEHPDRGTLHHQVEAQTLLHAADRDQRQPVVIKDVAEEALPEKWMALLDQSKAKTALLVPMVDASSEFIGIISLHYDDPKQVFSDDTIDIARTITSQIAVTLQNIRLLRNTQRQAQQLERIAGFSESIQATLNVEELLEIALISTAQIVVAEHISIAFYDQTRGMLHLVAWQDGVGTTKVMLEGGPQVEENTSMGHVWKERLPLQINDLEKETRFKHHSRDDLRAIMTLPVFSRGNARGVIEVGSVNPGIYTPIDGAVFQQLVSQLAVAMENAEAYTQSQRLAKSKAMANDISIQLQQQLSIEQILNVTMSELGKALGASRGRIRLDPEAVSLENGTRRNDDSAE